MSLCSQEHLLEAFPFMHAKCAEVALLLNVKDENEKVDGLMYAYKEADLCIRLYAKTLSTSAKDTAKTNQLVSTVYFARAEAVKRLILMGQVDFVPSTTPVVDAINDYCKCFAMNPEKVEALVDAILIAVDNGECETRVGRSQVEEYLFYYNIGMNSHCNLSCYVIDIDRRLGD